MFVETVIAVLVVGIILGAILWDVFVCDPLRRDLIAADRLRFKIETDRNRERHGYADYRRGHLGTPYIAPLPNQLERLLVDVDSHNGSRKAPVLRSVS